MVFGHRLRRTVACSTAGVATGVLVSLLCKAPRLRCAGEQSPHGTVPSDENAAVCHKKTWGVPWVEDWDNPQERGLPTQTRAVKRQLLLIRHGQYQKERTAKDDSEQVLTELGARQAEATGRFLADAIRRSDLYRAKSVSAVYVSDLTRARETCDGIMRGGLAAVCAPEAAATGPRVDPLLREIFPCDPQPPYPKKARPEAERIIEAAFGKYFHRPTGSEPSVEVVVAHANVIRYFLCRALQLPPEAWLRFSLPHCSVTMITIDGRGRVSVGGVGSANHLGPEDQSVTNVA